LTRGLSLKSAPKILSRDTLKFWVTDGKTTLQAIGFGMGRNMEELCGRETFGLVYNPRIDNWLGYESLILEVEKIV